MFFIICTLPNKVKSLCCHLLRVFSMFSTFSPKFFWTLINLLRPRYTPRHLNCSGHFIPKRLQLNCKALSLPSQRPSHFSVFKIKPERFPYISRIFRAEQNSALLLSILFLNNRVARCIQFLQRVSVICIIQICQLQLYTVFASYYNSSSVCLCVRNQSPPRSFDGSSPNLVGVCRLTSHLPLRGSSSKRSTASRVNGSLSL